MKASKFKNGEIIYGVDYSHREDCIEVFDIDDGTILKQQQASELADKMLKLNAQIKGLEELIQQGLEATGDVEMLSQLKQQLLGMAQERKNLLQ